MFDPAPATLHAVDGVSLAVAKGETLGLVGESGCGKSTLARMLVRLLPPSSGDILLQGESIWHGDASFIDSLPRRIQMIFQDPVSSLNPRRRVGASIREALDIHGVQTSAWRKERVEELLSLVGLRPEHYNRYPHEFSGGQRQRIAVARALVLNPEIIVCDEPVSALDVSVQAQVLNLLKELQKQFQLTYIFISHDLAVVGHVSDRVAVMYLGKIVELAPTRELFARPAHPYTQALLKAVPIPDPSAKEKHSYISGDLPSPINLPAGCRFHTRCPHAMPICSTTAPEWHTRSEKHTVACHLYS